MSAFRRFFGPLDACRHYPWSAHLLMLAPLTVVILYIGLRYGWWGVSVRTAYEAASAASPFLTAFMRKISAWSNFPLYAVYLALLIRGWKQGLAQGPEEYVHPDVLLTRRYVLFSVLLTLLFTQVVKYGLGMPRPVAYWPPQPFSFDFLYNSFPSGHTTEITATALPLGLRFRRWPVYVALALLIALVGYSRIWLSRHHPVDILGGMVMGSLIARLIFCCPDAPSHDAMFRPDAAR